MPKPKFKLPDRNWMVVAPATKILVQAPTPEDAVDKVLEMWDHTRNKPWLARGWRVYAPSERELREYAARAEGHRPSQPLAKQSKHKTVHERLGLPGV